MMNIDYHQDVQPSPYYLVFLKKWDIRISGWMILFNSLRRVVEEINNGSSISFYSIKHKNVELILSEKK
jgi:hypothetical protein